MKEFDEEVDVYAVNHLPIVKAYADNLPFASFLYVF